MASSFLACSRLGLRWGKLRSFTSTVLLSTKEIRRYLVARATSLLEAEANRDAIELLLDVGI